MAGISSLLFFVLSSPAIASSGTNQQISFEGKLTKSDGTNIADGTYNMEFKIYQDGTSSGSGSTLEWTEDYLVAGSTGMPSTGGVSLTSGTFQVNLGSICGLSGGTCGAKTNTGVDFNQQTLWVSIQIGNTSSCTVTSSVTSFNTACGGDGEMTPYIRLTAVPQALNADKLDGLDSTAFPILSGNNTFTGSTTFQPAADLISLIVSQATGTPTSDILDVTTQNGTKAIQVTGPSANNAAVVINSVGTGNNLTLDSASALNIGTTNATSIILGNVTNSTFLFKPKSSTTALQIQNANGNDNLVLVNTVTSNLIGNPSAEVDATGWSDNTGSATAPASSTTYALYGNSSLLITTAGTSTAGAKYDTTTLLNSATTYALSFWARIPSGGTSFTVQAGRSDNDTFAGESTCTLNTTSVTTVWTRFTCSFSTATVTTGGYVFIRQSDAGTRTWYVDGVQLEGGASVPSAYSEGAIQLNGVINSPITFKGQANSGSAFQIQNAAGGALLLVDSTSTDATGAIVNYLTYSDFESGSFSSATTGWTKVGSATLTQNTNKKNSYNGIASAQLVTFVSGDGLTTSSFVAPPPSGSYMVSFYARTSTGSVNTSTFTVQSTDGGTHTCSLTGPTSINASGFQRVYCSSAISTTGTMTALQITTTATGATIYIDGVQLQSTTYNSNSITAPTAYQLGQITIKGVITSPLTIANNGDSISAFQVQNSAGISLVAADTYNGQFIIGSTGALAGKIIFNSSSTGSVALVAGSTSSNLTLTLPTAAATSDGQCVTGTAAGALSFVPCGASSTATVTLVPEFVGAVLTGDGANNTGTMTSDFCSGSTALNINASICDGATTKQHNYYSWTSTAANDYDIWVRWQVPSDFSSWGASNPISWYSRKSASGDDVKMNIYTNTGSTCGTGTSMTNTAGSWQITNYSNSGCTPAAGNILVIDIHMAVATNADTCQMGEITLTYNRL